MAKVKEKEARREGKRNEDTKKRSNQRDNEKEETANPFSGTNHLATHFFTISITSSNKRHNFIAYVVQFTLCERGRNARR